MRRSPRSTQWRCIQPSFVGSWHSLTSQVQHWVAHLKSTPVSTDYLAWRHQILQQRLQLGLWVVLFWHSLLSATSLHQALFEFEELEASALEQFGDAAIATQWRGGYIAYYGGVIILLLMCIVAQRNPWVRCRPQVLFLLFTGSVGGLFAQISLSLFDIPNVPGMLQFLAIAVLIPVHWRLHLTYQSLSVAYYAIIYPLMGIATLGNDPYSIYDMEMIIQVLFVCLVSVLSIFLYERVKRSEFEVNRRLQMFLHCVSHDLKTPVVGTSVVLKSLLDENKGAATEVGVERSILEQLLQGSHRQLALIHSLLEAHTTEVQGIQLHCEPLALRSVVDVVLNDLHQELSKKHVRLTNHITDELPQVDVDANQLWRVFSNLIENSLKHNPHGIMLTVAAAVTTPGQSLFGLDLEQAIGGARPNRPMLLCVVCDSGIGIAPEQAQRLFEPYTRGSQARYMPGLGLGLYLCKQIITAHGGDIGVDSRPQEGTTFWFTLPIH